MAAIIASSPDPSLAVVMYFPLIGYLELKIEDLKWPLQGSKYADYLY
jgi:hypothetical protein